MLKICKKYWYNSIGAVLVGIVYGFTYNVLIGVFAAVVCAVGITAAMYITDK
jgi:hypothetical protein